MKNRCKLNPCCGDPYDCNPPRQYDEPAALPTPTVSDMRDAEGQERVTIAHAVEAFRSVWDGEPDDEDFYAEEIEVYLRNTNPKPSVAAEPVGEAGEMPGSNGGFTMAVFKASDVPLGTPLYARSPSTSQTSEA